MNCILILLVIGNVACILVTQDSWKRKEIGFIANKYNGCGLRKSRIWTNETEIETSGWKDENEGNGVEVGLEDEVEGVGNGKILIKKLVEKIGFVIEEGSGVKSEVKEEERTGEPLKSVRYDDDIDIYPLEQGGSQVPKLPTGEFKPRKSLGQNFITDLNLMNKMCNSLQDENEDSGDGRQVVELGCGIGSLTQILHRKYNKMMGIEIDKRAISQLSRTIPRLNVVHDDVLQINYKEISEKIGRKLWIIGNLPFYITSQILMCLLDFRKYIDRAVVTAQWEVAKRIVAPKNAHEYSILSALMQVYTTPKILFKIPGTCFYPTPKVDAACVRIDFDKNPDVNPILLRRILRLGFRQKRKKFKNSLKELERECGVKLPEAVLDLRPQDLTGDDYVKLTNVMERKIRESVGGSEGKGGEETNKIQEGEGGADSGFRELIEKDEGWLNKRLLKTFNESDEKRRGKRRRRDESEVSGELNRVWRKEKHGPNINVMDLM